MPTRILVQGSFNTVFDQDLKYISGYQASLNFPVKVL